MNSWFSLVSVVAIAVAVGTVLLHLMFAAAVYIDARRLIDRDKLRPVMVPGEIWALATLFGGVFVAIGYWIVHRTSIANLETVTPEFDIRDYLS